MRYFLGHIFIVKSIFFNYTIKKLKIQVGADYCLQENSDLKDAKKGAIVPAGGNGCILRKLTKSLFVRWPRGWFERTTPIAANIYDSYIILVELHHP